MALLQLIFFVARRTEGVRFVGKKTKVVSLMRCMAHRTLAFGKWFVNIWITLGQLIMAGKTGIGKISSDKSPIFARVRGMARTAIAFGHRLMHYSLCKRFFLILVAGIAQLIFPAAQQPFVAGNMGVMTNGTLQFLDRFVNHLATKGYFFVTLKTDPVCKSLSIESQVKAGQGKEGYKD